MLVRVAVMRSDREVVVQAFMLGEYDPFTAQRLSLRKPLPVTTNDIGSEGRDVMWLNKALFSRILGVLDHLLKQRYIEPVETFLNILCHRGKPILHVVLVPQPSKRRVFISNGLFEPAELTPFEEFDFVNDLGGVLHAGQSSSQEVCNEQGAVSPGRRTLEPDEFDEFT